MERADGTRRGSVTKASWKLRLSGLLTLLAVLAACERPTAATVFVYADRPIVVSDHSSGWRDVSVGEAHSCGLRLDGRLYCWGTNASGQLGMTQARGLCGLTSTACEASPRAAATQERFAQLSVGERHSCAVTVGGELRCWGESIQFQTGVEAATYVLVPTPVPLGMRVLQVSA